MASDANGNEELDSLEEVVDLKFLVVSVVRKCKLKHAGMVYLRNLTTVPVSFCFTQPDQPAFEVMPLSGVIDPFDVHFVSVGLLDPAAPPQDRPVLEKLELSVKAAQVSLESLLAREVTSKKGRQSIITKACERVQVSTIHPCVRKRRQHKGGSRHHPSSASEIMNASLSAKIKVDWSPMSGKGFAVDSKVDRSIEKIRTDAEFLKHQEDMLAELEDLLNANFSYPAKDHNEQGTSKAQENEGMHKAVEEEQEQMMTRPVQQDC
ncbi:hypothetical protein D918_02523 [Trichuris suis]|nr:hypothetical protein D918_02523 [Trichuris suis]